MGNLSYVLNVLLTGWRKNGKVLPAHTQLRLLILVHRLNENKDKNKTLLVSEKQDTTQLCMIKLLEECVEAS